MTSEIQGGHHWDQIGEFNGKPAYGLTLVIYEEQLEKMVANYDYACDVIRILSFYFHTRKAGDALEKLKEMGKKGD